MCNLGSWAGLDVAPLGLSNVCPNLDFRILEEVSPGNNNVLTWVRICVPPPQEAEQAAQAPHSRPDGQDVPTLQDWDCFLGSIKSDGWSCSLVYRFDHHHWASPDTSAFLAIPLTLNPPAPLDCSGAARCRAARPAAPRIRHWPWRCAGCCSRYLSFKKFEFQDI